MKGEKREEQKKEAATPHKVHKIEEYIVEIVSDSGEGAQTAGQMFGRLCAKMGNGVWTVEIIPAEIEPPQRSRAGASGNRIRIGSKAITNAGDTADLVIAFNEQVLYSRIDQGAFRPGTRILLESKWKDDPRDLVRKSYQDAMADFEKRGFEVTEIPMDVECLKLVDDAKRGKNIWVVGMLCSLFSRSLEVASREIKDRFGKKGEKIIAKNMDLLHAGFEWAEANLPESYELEAMRDAGERVVMNGNQAIALGSMAAGMEMCAMYPITPATSVSHYLASYFEKAGGFVHQAEDEIAAVGFAIGASYAGKTALTVTSGPGLALKTEFLGLAVMSEVPLVVVDVQRGGPSTGLPTKVEQSDLLASFYASTGDAPKIIIAPATIEECFHFMIMARKLAETYRGPVFVLSDANLATGVQPFPKPQPREDWLSPPLDQSRWDKDIPPYDWDEETGLSPRPIPGQRDGNYVLTGLAHDRHSHVAYESGINQKATEMRSLKLSTLQRTLKPPSVYGDDGGDLLVVGWGSTKGAIEEAIDKLRAEGHKVSSLHLRFLLPLEPGLKDIFNCFKKVTTVEINFSDESGRSGMRRYAQLATILRSETLHEVDCWSKVPGTPLQPQRIYEALLTKLQEVGGEQ